MSKDKISNDEYQRLITDIKNKREKWKIKREKEEFRRKNPFIDIENILGECLTKEINKVILEKVVNMGYNSNVITDVKLDTNINRLDITLQPKINVHKIELDIKILKTGNISNF